MSKDERKRPGIITDVVIPLESIGTPYGEWSVPVGFVGSDTTYYGFGAGTDISFEVGLASKYKCTTHIFDPTPKAKEHFDYIIDQISSSQQARIGTYADRFYEISKQDLELLKFYPIGIWNKKDLLKFYSPKNENNVSHSALNLQRTDKYFEAKVNTLRNIMDELGHKSLDILKIDIEGAEYKVIDNILADKLDVKYLCLEFDEYHHPLDENYVSRITEYISKIRKAGYALVLDDGGCNYAFIRWSELQKNDPLIRLKSIGRRIKRTILK